MLALVGFVANVGTADVPSRYWSETQAWNYVHAEQVVSDVTGHPLSPYVVRTDPRTVSSRGQGQVGSHSERPHRLDRVDGHHSG